MRQRRALITHCLVTQTGRDQLLQVPVAVNSPLWCPVSLNLSRNKPLHCFCQSIFSIEIVKQPQTPSRIYASQFVHLLTDRH